MYLLMELTPKDIARFWSKVEKRKGRGCWPWLAYLNNKGYGMFPWRSKRLLASRVSLSLKLKRPLEAGECALHRCDNPACVRPSHLFVGTQADNLKDMRDKGRQGKAYNGGSANPNCKITEEDVREIRRLHGTMPQKDIAATFGLTASMIHKIVNRKTWKSVQ